MAATKVFENIDTRHYSYEWYIFINNTKFVKLTIIGLFVLKTLDWLTSIIALQKYGLVEANPLAAKIFETYGIWITLFLGYIVTFIYVLVLEGLKNSLPIKVYWFMYTFLFCMYTFVVINNFAAIQYYS
ncbi:MAG: DUF5658 family protein [Asgard group archaeon]